MKTRACSTRDEPPPNSCRPRASRPTARRTRTARSEGLLTHMSRKGLHHFDFSLSLSLQFWFHVKQSPLGIRAEYLVTSCPHPPQPTVASLTSIRTRQTSSYYLCQSLKTVPVNPVYALLMVFLIFVGF